MEGMIKRTRRQYGDNRRAEFEGRMRQHNAYELTEPEAQLLFEAGVMPWDPRTIVSNTLSHGLTLLLSRL